MELFKVLLEGALVLATFTLVLVTFMLYRASVAIGQATDRLADLAESEQVEKQRPRLVVKSVRREVETSLLHIKIKNFGSGIAEDIIVKVGDGHWQSNDGVYATRVPPSAKILGPGEESEWSITEREAKSTDEQLLVDLICQGTHLPPGAGYRGSWGSYYGGVGGVFPIVESVNERA